MKKNDREVAKAEMVKKRNKLRKMKMPEVQKCKEMKNVN